MRALFVNDFPSNTGIGNYAFSLFKELGKRESGIEMLYLNSNNDFEAMQGTRAIKPSINFPVLNQTINNLLFFPWKIPKGFGLVHASNQGLAAVAAKNKPSVVSCMDIIPMVLAKDYNFFWSLLQQRAIKKLGKADAIITISEFSRKELSRVLGVDKEKVTVTLLGFDKETFREREKNSARKKLGLRAGERIVLSVGAEEPRKNIPFVLQVFKELCKEVGNARLVRVGKRLESNRKIIERLGIRGRVSYFEGVSREELGLFYNAADLFFFPSSYEGFGLPVLEAMASGCPVLTSRLSSIPEVGGEAVQYFEGFESGGVREKAARILENDSMQRKLVEKGLERAENFSWEKCAEETLKVYERVLRES